MRQHSTVRYALITAAGLLISLTAPQIFAQESEGMAPTAESPAGESKPDAKAPSAHSHHAGKKGEPKRDAASVHKKKHKKKHHKGHKHH